MAQALREESVTPADELRALLAGGEKQVPNLPAADPTGAAALHLLESLDRLAELWPQVEAMGVDLRPEEGRYETLLAQVRKQTPRILNGMAGQGGLAYVRRQRFGAAEAPWWWRLDELRREELTQRARRTALTVAVIAVLAAVAVFAVNKAFPTDPKVSAASASMMTAQQQLMNGADPAEVIAKFQEAATLTPDDPEPWLWLGVAQEKLGRTAEAEDAFRRARTLIGSESAYHIARAPVYQGFNLLDEATREINAALAADPDNPRAYYYLAGIYEMQGKYDEAIAALETTSQLAEAAQQPEITAMARYRMGMLMQQMQIRPSEPAGASTAAP